MERARAGYPLHKLEIIKNLILSGTGPVAIASHLRVSRPTANRMIAETRVHYGLSAGPKVDALAGGLNLARKAKRLLAEGRSDTAIFRELGVGRRRGARILESARTLGAVTSVADPRVMEAQIVHELDVVREIVACLDTMSELAQAAKQHLETLQCTTDHDTEERGGAVRHSGWHRRQANILRALDTMRKVEESRLKTLDTHQRVLQRLLDVNRVSKLLKNLGAGTRAGLTLLCAQGRLTCPIEEAMEVVHRATKEHFAAQIGMT